MTRAMLGVTGDEAIPQDGAFTARLIDAFLRADESTCYAADSQWTVIRQKHDAMVRALRARDTEYVARALARPHEGYLLYGFEDLGAWSVEAYRSAERRTAYADHCRELLVQLARVIGVVPLANPEAPERTIAVPDVPDLLGAIERALGIAISPPAPYPFYYGLASDRGVLGVRVLNALYCAHRVRQLTQNSARARVLEIGAGLGRLAHYCHRMGLTDYWIVDVPMTSLVQAHFLAHAVGADRIVLDGEIGAHERPDAIKILTPERFFADASLEFDLVVNTDSLTELGRATAERYFRKAAELAPAFLSVNHEVNEFRVLDLHEPLAVFASVDRRPYCMRAGYVEEIYSQPRPPVPGLRSRGLREIGRAIRGYFTRGR